MWLKVVSQFTINKSANDFRFSKRNVKPLAQSCFFNFQRNSGSHFSITIFHDFSKYPFSLIIFNDIQFHLPLFFLFSSSSISTSYFNFIMLSCFLITLLSCSSPPLMQHLERLLSFPLSPPPLLFCLGILLIMEHRLEMLSSELISINLSFKLPLQFNSRSCISSATLS